MALGGVVGIIYKRWGVTKKRKERADLLGTLASRGLGAALEARGASDGTVVVGNCDDLHHHWTALGLNVEGGRGHHHCHRSRWLRWW